MGIMAVHALDVRRHRIRILGWIVDAGVAVDVMGAETHRFAADVFGGDASIVTGDAHLLFGCGHEQALRMARRVRTMTA